MKDLLIYGVLAYFLYSIFKAKPSTIPEDKGSEGNNLSATYTRGRTVADTSQNMGVAQFDIASRRNSHIDQKGMGEYFDKQRGAYHRDRYGR